MRQSEPKNDGSNAWSSRAGLRARAILVCFAAAIVPFFLVGCGSSVPHRRASLSPSGAGDSWHAVLPSPIVSASDEIGQGDLAYARRDDALALRADAPLNGVAESWPSPERPSLAQTRRLYLNNRPETVVYFRDSDRRRTYRAYDR